jgi:chemotaxis protein methyltransferase CheR
MPSHHELTTALPGTTLARLSRFVAKRMGLHFPRERWPDLERGLQAVAQESGFETLEPCVEWLTSSPSARRQIETLASHLTVGETYFFREPRTFEALEQRVLPELAHSRPHGERQLRLWSAACATGEEPYSLAITVQRVLPGLAGRQANLLATDIDPRRLRHAAAGIYGPWSFRDPPGWLKEQYFTRTREGRFQVAPAIRSMVTFAYLNLAEDAYPSLLNGTNALDLILCRNVLMYFSAEWAARIVENLCRCLVPGGWLVVSPSETTHLASPGLAPVRFPGATLYRKEGHRAAPAPTPLFRIEGKPTPVFEPGFQSEPRTAAAAAASVPPPAPAPIVPEPLPSSNAPPVDPQLAEAVRLQEQGANAEAIARLEDLLSEHPAFAPAMLLLARSLANQGRLSPALEWCDRVIAVDKLNGQAHYLRAGILQELGAAEEAGAALQRVLYLEPGFVLAHAALGNLALRRGKTAAADRHFRNALQLLGTYAPEQALAQAEGVTAGRLAEIIAATRELEIAS